MLNPVEILGRSSRRIANVAAARLIAGAVLPALVAVCLAAFLPAANALIWRRWGYAMAPGTRLLMIEALVATSTIIGAVAIVRAIWAYRRARSFVHAGEKVDDAVGAHQQILTLATLADPSVAKSSESRSPLFPILWRTAASFLESFNPQRAFPFEVGRPVLRSSIVASGIALALIFATLGTVHRPTPLQREAMKLREIASDLEKNPTGPGDLALAGSIRSAADALENPKLSPEERKDRLDQVMREMASHSDQKQGGGNQPGNGRGNAGGNGLSKEGKESNQPGEGPNQTSANQPSPPSGTGSGGAGSSSGNDEKGNQSGKDKNSIELQNELSKAEAELETEGSKNPNPNQPGGNDQKSEQAGNNPNQPGAGNGKDPNQPGNVPTQGAQGKQEQPQNGGNQQARDQGSNQGDTHLGEFPIPAKTQRFLKPGEGGNKLNVHDARYVMFRLPTAVPVGAGGTTVIDNSRLKASTPYTNAPLKETSSDAPPDERQLVPPRYRDLIH